MKKSCGLIVAVLLIITIISLSMAVAETGKKYSLTALGDLPGGDFYSLASGINNSGQVAGYSKSLNAIGSYLKYEAFIWTPVIGMTALGDLSGGEFASSSYDINNPGQVAGSSNSLNNTINSSFEAFVWNSVNGMAGLGDLPGRTFKSEALGINDSAQVVGYGNSASAGKEAFIWDSVNGMRALGDLPGGVYESVAREVNNTGQVAGYSISASGNEAFIWDSINKMRGLGGLPGGVPSGLTLSEAYDINDLGRVVGFSRSANGTEAFVWDSVNGMSGLGDLPGSSFYSIAQAINSLGQIVGSGSSSRGGEPFIWFPDLSPVYGMVSLNDLLDSSGTGWVLNQAFDINDSGQIVGVGINPAGQTEAFLLTPLPGPTDADNDGLLDANDNCPFKANPGQEDCDSNGIGNACDYTSVCSLDIDADGVNDGNDNCPNTYNPDQADCDNDGLGNVCDPATPCSTDSDHDGIMDSVDNCPNLRNPDQIDCNGDGIGVVCNGTELPLCTNKMTGLFTIEAGSYFQDFWSGITHNISGGTDRGLLTGQFQSDPPPTSATGDFTGSNRIIDPNSFIIYGFPAYLSTNLASPICCFPVPTILDAGNGTITGDISSWDLLSNGTHHRTGAAIEGGIFWSPPYGTYNPATSIYTLSWQTPGDVVEPFYGIFYLTGHFVSGCTDNDSDGYGIALASFCPNGTVVDCNDNNANINPGKTDNNCNGIDDNCSGPADEGYVATAASCGAGLCASTGQNICQNGTVVNTCMPGTPQIENDTLAVVCNDGIDNDCDGLTDSQDQGCISLNIDNDGDGYCEVAPCVIGTSGGDCDDTNNKVYPRAPRLCDGKDNDCDGRLDFGTDIDNDKDGVAQCGSDCNDNNANMYPGNPEIGTQKCGDGMDNDCDKKIDMSDPDCLGCIDKDGDGYGSNGHPLCTNGTAIDCNDNNANIHPNAADICNGIDDDCDGMKDEGFVPAIVPCGVGACAATGLSQCINGIVDMPCTPRPPQQEGPMGDLSCNDSIDNDCDGTTDGSDNSCLTTCLDADGDGYGANGNPSCPNGTAVDCNDSNSAINPGAADNNCNGVDNNCNGTADEGYIPTQSTCGIGACAATGQNICQNGTIVNNCNPLPSQTESYTIPSTCNDGIDNDCDAKTDSADPECNPLNVDNDGDGYCEVGPCLGGASPGDCDDTDRKVYKGAPRICDGKDSDCDGRIDFSTDVDKDKDGWPVCVMPGQKKGDCNDNNPFVCPGCPEICGDGIDNDCDVIIDMKDPDCTSCLDSDGDGYGISGLQLCPMGPAFDCNDKNASINPGALDNNCDGIDNNCNGTPDEGYVPPPSTCGVGVCTATGQNVCQNGTIVNNCTPGTPQIEGPLGDASCGDGIDNDCDGTTDTADVNCLTSCLDTDGDGYGANGDPSCPMGVVIDCNDSNPLIPGPDNNCNGKDDDCNGIADDGYVMTVTTCGIGECRRTGQKICMNGTEIDTCVPGLPATEGPVGTPTCSDAKDNDCDGLTDNADIDSCTYIDPCGDTDGDGYCCNPGFGVLDCDCSDPKVFPGAVTTVCDGKDTNCDGRRDFSTDVDNDKDGFPICILPGYTKGDCNDNNPNINPGKVENAYCPSPNFSCNDGIDNDCDGKVDGSDASCRLCDDCDGDGYGKIVTLMCTYQGTDCNDTYKNISPAAAEGPVGSPTCSDVMDNNCNGMTDAADPGCV